MRSKTSGTVFLLAWLLLVAPIFAQMGYPLKGSWSGDWWLKKGEENHLLLDFDWDGKTLTGVLNPGTDNVVLKNSHSSRLPVVLKEQSIPGISTLKPT